MNRTVVVWCCWLALAPLSLAEAGNTETLPKESVAGTFELKFNRVATPKEEWGTESEADWLLQVSGKLKAPDALSYRKAKIPAGTYDLWIERGKGEWFYVYVGDRDDESADRLRALLKLYEREEGEEEAAVELKLTAKGKKLRLSFFSGKSEGRCHLRLPAKAKGDGAAGPESR